MSDDNINDSFLVMIIQHNNGYSYNKIINMDIYNSIII